MFNTAGKSQPAAPIVARLSVQHLDPMILVDLTPQANLSHSVTRGDAQNDGQMTVKGS
jgi:hypothetical protein